MEARPVRGASREGGVGRDVDRAAAQRRAGLVGRPVPLGDTAYALGAVREFYRAVGAERIYEIQEDPRGVVRLRSGAKSEEYDASFEVDQVRRGYDQVMKGWRDAPARRAGAGWSSQLDRELTSLVDPVSALTRVNAGERAAVAPAAERVRLQVERIRPLVQAHERELPQALLEGWERLSGWVRSLGRP